MIGNQIPGLDEIGMDHGREAEVEKVLSQAAVHIPVSELELSPPVAVQHDATIRQAVNRMNEFRIGSIIIMKGTELVGIVTERDILKKAADKKLDLSEVPISKVMTPTPRTLAPTDLVIDAMALMSEGGYRRMPVVAEDGTPVGIFSIRKIIDRLVEFFPEEILNLPPNPVRSMDSREGA